VARFNICCKLYINLIQTIIVHRQSLHQKQSQS